ncbi:profilin-A-like [Limulus polyphemus]|uniref:Profilin n=1 Tax=Limulus polyphemus TaxID=6850 RepID=A0ABM1TIH9_LIMPO|nr:profilin-A-like [Limulus polyphemus]
MSWNTYVDVEICSRIRCRIAVIAGHDGGVWASHGQPTSQAELKIIADQMKTNPAVFQEKGIFVGGDRYICLHAEEDLVRGRKGGSALCIVKTGRSIIVAAAEDGESPGKLNVVVEKLGEYLNSAGC